jgi:hypothetical protein
MNPTDRTRPTDDGSGGDDTVLRRATEALRAVDDDRWVEIAPRILQTALGASRRTRPVRATAASGPLQISDRVIVEYLREALDGAVPGAAVDRITVRLAGRDTFDGLVIELLVRYGVAVIPVADLVREIASGVLRRLGVESVEVSIRTTHVHVVDVTRTDPNTYDA